MKRRALWKGKRRRFKQADYRRAKYRMKPRPPDGWNCQRCVDIDNTNYAREKLVRQRDQAFWLTQEEQT